MPKRTDNIQSLTHYDTSKTLEALAGRNLQLTTGTIGINYEQVPGHVPESFNGNATLYFLDGKVPSRISLVDPATNKVYGWTKDAHIGLLLMSRHENGDESITLAISQSYVDNQKYLVHRGVCQATYVQGKHLEQCISSHVADLPLYNLFRDIAKPIKK